LENFRVLPSIEDWPSSRNTPVPEMNPFLQTPCQVTEPCAAISLIRFAAASEAHNLQPRESVNTTSPAFASADLPFNALPAFFPAASATDTSATRAPTITIQPLRDITILFATLHPNRRSPHSTDCRPPSIQEKTGK
jgi:hypothetical protein